MVIVPPIKSQGIKTKLVPFIMELVNASRARGRWIEPFMGTGVVGFNAGFRQAIMNDTNPHLINFYKGIQSGEITPGRVREYLQHEGKLLLNADDNGYAHYRFIKERFNNAGFAPLDFLFLNRAGFNGMIRFSKKGGWNIPFCKKPKRFSQSYVTKICNQVRKVGEIMNEDWQFTVSSFENTINSAGPDDIIYCDPPYYGRYVDYYNGWKEEDEERLYHSLKNTKAKFILSTWSHNEFRHNTMIDRFWGEFNVLTKEHFYHGAGRIENRKEITEALYFNFEIGAPSTAARNNPQTETNHQLAFDLL